MKQPAVLPFVFTTVLVLLAGDWYAQVTLEGKVWSGKALLPGWGRDLLARPSIWNHESTHAFFDHVAPALNRDHHDPSPIGMDGLCQLTSGRVVIQDFELTFETPNWSQPAAFGQQHPPPLRSEKVLRLVQPKPKPSGVAWMRKRRRIVGKYIAVVVKQVALHEQGWGGCVPSLFLQKGLSSGCLQGRQLPVQFVHFEFERVLRIGPTPVVPLLGVVVA